VLDALPEEEKSRLEGKRGELIEKLDLIVDLLLRESASEVFRPDGCPEKSDAGPTNVLDVIDRRLRVPGVEAEADAKEGILAEPLRCWPGRLKDSSGMLGAVVEVSPHLSTDRHPMAKRIREDAFYTSKGEKNAPLSQPQGVYRAADYMYVVEPRSSARGQTVREEVQLEGGSCLEVDLNIARTVPSLRKHRQERPPLPATSCILRSRISRLLLLPSPSRMDSSQPPHSHKYSNDPSTFAPLTSLYLVTGLPKQVTSVPLPRPTLTSVSQAG
jgi:hypothetical protein